MGHEAKAALRTIHHLTATAKERAERPWMQDPFSNNALHQVKEIDTSEDHFGVQILRWRGGITGDRRQSGFMVVGAGAIDGTDNRVLYRGTDQDRAWQTYRQEKGRIKDIIKRFIVKAQEYATLGNDSQLLIKIKGLVGDERWDAASRHLQGYVESFNDPELIEDSMPIIQDVADLDPYPFINDPEVSG
jgi:hypothetical protein